MPIDEDGNYVPYDDEGEMEFGNVAPALDAEDLPHLSGCGCNKCALEVAQALTTPSAAGAWVGPMILQAMPGPQSGYSALKCPPGVVKAELRPCNIAECETCGHWHTGGVPPVFLPMATLTSGQPLILSKGWMEHLWLWVEPPKWPMAKSKTKLKFEVAGPEPAPPLKWSYCTKIGCNACKAWHNKSYLHAMSVAKISHTIKSHTGISGIQMFDAKYDQVKAWMESLLSTKLPKPKFVAKLPPRPLP